MSDVSLRLCGHPTVERTGGEAAVALPAKAMGLIAYLALESGPHSREELTTLLWGEFPEEKANASLRHALSELRATFNGDLKIDRSTVELDPAVPCDVTAFVRLAGRDPEGALRTEIPRFLSGLNLKNCPGWEEWLETTRASLFGKYVVAL